MVGVLRDAKPKQGARVRRRAGSCTIGQGVVKSRGRKIEGAELAYLLVGFFILCFTFFISCIRCLGTRTCMQY